MSGHNKWSKVKHKKAAEDAKKSKEFGKFARLIVLESKKAGGNVNAPNLRTVIERAKAVNMPNQNIDRAVKKGLDKDASLLEEAVYEAYGPGGSALVITCLTDNKNRTAPEIRHLLAEHGGTWAERGAASWAFEKKEDQWIPQTTVTLSPEDGEELGVLIDVLEDYDDVQNVFTNAV